MSDVAGKSVLDLLWERLDAFVNELMAKDMPHPDKTADPDFREIKGRAYGMAEAIALITNPYHPDIDAVRADAVERWEQRQGVPQEPQDDHPAARRYEERRARRLARRAARNS